MNVLFDIVKKHVGLNFHWSILRVLMYIKVGLSYRLLPEKCLRRTGFDTYCDVQCYTDSKKTCVHKKAKELKLEKEMKRN